MHRPSTAVALCLLALCFVVGVTTTPTKAASPQKTADNGAAEAAAIRKSFRRHNKPELVHDARSDALRAARSFDSAAVVTALVQAYQNLELECAPIEKKRHKSLLKDSGERLQVMRDAIQPLHDLQERIHAHLLRVQSREGKFALGKMLAQKRLPMRLQLAGARVAAAFFDTEKMRPKEGQRLEELLVILEAARSLDRAGKEFVDYAFAALRRPEPIARERALATLAAIQVPRSLPVLVDYLGSETEHRLRIEAGKTLCILTQQDLGPSHVSWSAWLRERGAPYLNGTRRLGGGKPGAGQGGGSGYYFGIPLDRSSILFVHDNSLSMRQKLGDETRLQRSLEELYKALDALEPTQRFNIVLLANRVWSFETKQVRATKKNVQRAKDWMRYQPIELGTCIYNALDAAFVLAGRGVRDRYYDSEVDTIFLLSDGAPTPYLRGGRNAAATRSPEKQEWILDAVDRWNLFDRVQLHTILLGAPPPRPNGRGRPGGAGRRGGATGFMRSLAERNNGRFIAIGATGNRQQDPPKPPQPKK